MPCENTFCYMGGIALVDENGNVNYEHRDNVRKHIATVMMEETKLPHALVDVVVELSCSKGRWNPCKIEGAYESLMKEALDKCGAVQTQLDILMPGHTLAVKAEVTDAVLEAIFARDEEDGRSWYDIMLGRYFDRLDRNFACKVVAMEAAEAVWNTRCDDEGVCVASMAWEYINNMQKNATEAQRLADTSQRVASGLCRRCGKPGSSDCYRSWCSDGFVWVETMSNHSALEGQGSVGYFQPWRVRWDKDKVEFVLV